MPIKVGEIELHLGPKEQGGPDSLVDPIIEFIQRAKQRQKLMIAVQEIDNRKIAEAIVDARLRGVNVELVVEQSYLLGQKRPIDLAKAFLAEGAHEDNRFLLNAIFSFDSRCKNRFQSEYFPSEVHGVG